MERGQREVHGGDERRRKRVRKRKNQKRRRESKGNGKRGENDKWKEDEKNWWR